MKPQEKKYRVASFSSVQAVLAAVGATKVKDVHSVHYYGQHEGNDVEKFVVYPDRVEIHVLTESDGQFTMAEHRKISGKEEGITWLKDRGYTTINIVRMEYAEYAYKNGTVGLYVIDGFLHSVILYYPPGVHDAIEDEFGLSGSEVISVPYNVYLKKLGKLQVMEVH